MKEEKIKVLALLPMELPKAIELDNTLEAMQKFVGQNRISELALQDGCKFVVFVGAKKLIKRKKFEEFLDEQYAI